ncbi:MAG: ferredoxin--NADP reductase [Clostridia bacterium]
MEYETRLLRRETVAEGTVAFYFERPAGFAFEAGQNVTLSLIDPPESDSLGTSRTFTLASAPHEADLMVATRMRDTAFKRILRGAPLGARLKLDGPAGSMVLGADPKKPVVFLAGGIGVTPFLAMARHAAAQRLTHRIHLFYSNRRPEDAAFLGELRMLERTNPRFRFIPTMTQMDKSSLQWDGSTGPIGMNLLSPMLGNPKDAVYYFAGPPSMAMSMYDLLQRLGVAADDMQSEEFYGY